MTLLLETLSTMEQPSRYCNLLKMVFWIFGICIIDVADIGVLVIMKKSQHKLLLVSSLFLDCFHLNFQITGLTNNSYFVEAHEVRHCVLKYGSLSEYVLKVAKVWGQGFISICLSCIRFIFIMICFSSYYGRDLKSCRKGWMICFTLDLLRTIENQPLCLEILSVHRWYLGIQHLARVQTLKAWMIQVSNLKYLIQTISQVCCWTYNCRE